MKYVERKDYNKVITIKLVIPGGCNAHCCFCYLNDYPIMHNSKDEFLKNFIGSIDYLLNKIGNKNEVSLDITGNEPTFDTDFLIEVLNRLRKYNIKSKVLRTTMTTNGFHLKEVAPYLEGVIDYVNISVHHYDEIKRKEIFKTCILKNNDYTEVIDLLKKYGIKTSAVGVIFSPIDDFPVYFNEFISWCKDKGFVSLRLRNDVFWKDSTFDEYMDYALNQNRFQIITHEKTPDSHWCRLRDIDKFRIFFLHGVKDTSIVVKGIEYVVAEDGKAYCDFYKNTKIEDYEYEVGKIYDAI